MDVEPSILAQIKLAFASLVGALARLYFRPAATFLRSLWLVGLSIAFGYFFTPIAMDVFGFDPSWRDGVAVILGLVGLSIAEGVLLVNWKAIVRALVQPWIAKETSDKD